MPNELTPAELDNQAIWSMSDVCRYFRTSRKTVKGWIAKGLPVIMFGIEYKFERQRVLAWIRRKYQVKAS